MRIIADNDQYKTDARKFDRIFEQIYHDLLEPLIVPLEALRKVYILELIDMTLQRCQRSELTNVMVRRSDEFNLERKVLVRS